MSLTPISAVTAKLDAQESVRRKIESANQLMFDAMRTAVEYDHALCENLFGMDANALKTLAEAPRTKLAALSMTGVPFWSFRLASPEFIRALDARESNDVLFRLLLRNFNSPVPLSNIGADIK